MLILPLVVLIKHSPFSMVLEMYLPMPRLKSENLSTNSCKINTGYFMIKGISGMLT
jgi:hypothetical protein